MRAYRIQPAGLELDHLSEDSNGDTLGLHVFGSIHEAFACEGFPQSYGDEVVEIETPELSENGDVEGCLIPASRIVESRIVARYTLDDFAKKHAKKVAGLTDDDLAELDADDLDGVPLSHADCPYWYVVTNSRKFFE